MRREIALDHVYQFEAETPDRLWLTQPMGGGEIRTYTWKEAMDEVRRMAAYLKSLDLPEKSQIALFSKNSAWWFLADLAIWMAGHVTVPIYPTLPPDVVAYVLEHSESKAIFIGKLDGYEDMAPGIPADMPRIETPLGPGTDAPKWADIVAETEPLEGHVWRDPEEMATIHYTSGSTARPKGVMLSFKAMADSAKAIIDLLGIDGDDRVLSYLPLAHVFERWVVETVSITVGMRIWFAEDLSTFVADLRRAEPTLFISVPRLWQKFQQGVLKNMPAERLDFLLKIPIVKGMIRKRVLTALGLQAVRFAGSGSAPIPKELIQWYRNLGLELLEGYGMSENFTVSHVTRPGRVRPGYVGEPYPGVECRIGEAGEIQVKSPGTMMGYFKNEAATKETFTEDGWLKTGDKGEIDEEGRLKITGRIKEIFKTAKGKYVAPAPIENQLMLHDAVEIAVVGGSGMPQPHAIVVLSEDLRPKLSAGGGPRDEVEASLESLLKQVNAELPHHERLSFLALVNEAWTVEDGVLTPTLKVKRRVVEDRYGEATPGWYDQKKPVIWT